MSTDFTQNIARHLGTTDASIRLITSLFVPYILSIIYRNLLLKRSSKVKNRFLAISGVVISVFNHGYHVCHSLGAVIFSYALLQIVPPSASNVIINFVFHMAYLLTGYWVNADDEYDFTWTMPHCVLTLKLIGLSFDLWDGTKDPEKLSHSFKKTALKRQPQFLEMMSFVFFPASYLVGPQFTMIKYLDYIDGKLDEMYNTTAVKESLKRCVLGILYLTFYQIGSRYVNEHMFSEDEMLNSNIFVKHLWLGVLTKVFITKYVACWLITEGACILFGLAYNGRSEQGATLWDGCRNVHLGTLERVLKYDHYIQSFNTNTNAWVAQNVYKRMMFLNNPKISRLVALAFIAVWHGVYSGYYIAFLLQFFIMVMEKDLEVILPTYFPYFVKFTEKSYVYPFTYIFMKLYSSVFLGYAVIPFGLLRFDKWWPVHKSLYFSAYVIFMPYMFLYRPMLMHFCRKYGQKGKKEKN